MGCASLSSLAKVGFFFFFCDLLGCRGGLTTGLSTCGGLTSPEMRQQYFSSSLVILMKSSLGALKRQLLLKIFTTSAWNCAGVWYLPPFSLVSMVVRSIGSFTISRYSGMLRPSTSTGSMNGSAHLCCCSICRVLRQGFTNSFMESWRTTAFFGGICGCWWLLVVGLGLKFVSMAAASSNSSGVFFLACGLLSFLRWSTWKEKPLGNRVVSASISSADSSTLNTSLGVYQAGREAALWFSSIILSNQYQFSQTATPPLASPPQSAPPLKYSRAALQLLGYGWKCNIWVRLRAIYYRYQFKIMIFNRNKQSKTETPTRSIQPLGKITPLLAGPKKSDPFLKELKEVYDKQNIHPNLRENRTKSYHTKTDAQDNRSPIKKVMNLKQIHKNSNAPTRKQNEGLNSHSKYSQSSELQRVPVKSRSSNRKSTEKDEQQFHFQDQYYPSKEEKKEKKMKVTLKDIKRQRKSVHEADGEYMGKPNGDTRETISQDSLNKDISNVQMAKNQQQQQITVHSFEPAQSSQPKPMKADLCCWNHPEKKATHQLQSQDQSFCEKCAVNLAINGCQLVPIQQGRQRLQRLQVQEERLGEIKDFLFELDKMEPIFKRTMRRIQNYRYFLGSKLEEEGKKLDIYYGNLCTVIKNSYETAKTTLKLHYDAIMEEIDNNAFIVNAHAEEIAGLKQDILPNIGQIIKETRVCSDIFTTKIHYNYGRLEEAERVVREIEGYNCNYYQFRFENVEHLLVQLRSLISPALQPAYFDSSFQTQRKNTQQSQEKRFDPFRMSFGKSNGSAHRF